MQARSTSHIDQIHCVGKGGVDQLKKATVLKPELGPTDIGVRVEYAGVCFADGMARRGMYPAIPPYPYVPGYECSGVVEAIGSQVTAFAPGDRVAAYLPKFGAYSEYITVRAEQLARIPHEVTSAQAASLIVNYLTAHVLLHRMGAVKAEQTVVITSAAGGVGTAVLDLGRVAGLKMFGIASTAKLDVIRKRGATAIDRKDDFEVEIRRHAPAGVDLFIDNVGGETLSKGYRLLRKGGLLINNGALSIQGSSRNDFLPVLISLYLKRLLPDGKRTEFNPGIPPIVGRDPNWYRQTMQDILKLVATGQIDPLISKIFPLSRAAEAHTLLESGQTYGKIILDCD